MLGAFVPAGVNVVAVFQSLQRFSPLFMSCYKLWFLESSKCLMNCHVTHYTTTQKQTNVNGTDDMSGHTKATVTGGNYNLSYFHV